MHELADRSGLTKTTIHHYARERLLPPAHKTAPNAAEYDRSHLDRLELISRLRADDGDTRPLSIPEIRRVLEHVEAGTDLSMAVRLVEEGVEAASTPDGGWRSVRELAAAAALPPQFVDALAAVGLIGDGRDDGLFTAADLVVARACHAVCAERGLDPADLTPLADLIREVGNYSDTLVEVHTVRAADEAPDQLGRELARLCDVLLWRALQA